VFADLTQLVEIVFDTNSLLDELPKQIKIESTSTIA
jgi:hypothetical protein